MAAAASAGPASASREWEGLEWVAEGWAAGGEADDGSRKSTPTARKYWSESPKKPADACFRSPRKSRSVRFMPRFRKSYATNTTWVTRQIPLSPDITKSSSPRPRKISSSRPGTDTTETNKLRYPLQAAREPPSDSPAFRVHGPGFPGLSAPAPVRAFPASALPDDCAVPEWLPPCWVLLSGSHERRARFRASPAPSRILRRSGQSRFQSQSRRQEPRESRWCRGPSTGCVPARLT